MIYARSRDTEEMLLRMLQTSVGQGWLSHGCHKTTSIAKYYLKAKERA